MSSKSHNNFVGITFSVIGVLGVLATLNHFTLEKWLKEPKIISKERYEQIAEVLVPVAINCVRIEDLGTRGVTQDVIDQQCIKKHRKKDSNVEIQDVKNYNNYHSLQAQFQRFIEDAVALLGGGVSAVGVVAGIGYTKD